MKSLLFVLQFTLPTFVFLVLLLLWIGYLNVWPMLVAEKLFASQKAFPNDVQYGEWKDRDEFKCRPCTLDIGFHEFRFIQCFPLANGDQRFFVEELSYEIKLNKAILCTCELAVLTALSWLCWQKAIAFLFKRVFGVA